MKILVAAAFCLNFAHAQVAASLRLEKRLHLADEPVLATVTITNHAGRDLVFQSDGRFQWLDFILKSSNGDPVTPKGNSLFGAMKIGAGQVMVRTVNLSDYYQLSEPGNYSLLAVIRMPGSKTEGATTNTVFFTQSSGRIYWSQKVGIIGRSNQMREYRAITFTSETKSQLYAQIMDCSSGQLVRTFLLGDVLMLRKPVIAVDRQQRMNVLFMATPAMWVLCVVNTDGKLVERQIHQRTSSGDPQLLTFGDGSVKVANSIPYDAKAAAEQKAKIRKASDRPEVTYQ
ncbi:MAG: hypothetical protein H8M99_09740 [Gloeobacteraceae cyanobacterium ES-bin-144]|nr:hypothetical protein [Verrucomicrobiales bacterium]